jgi:hypothetical protein
MTEDIIPLLAAVNPVREVSAVPGVEDLLGLIDARDETLPMPARRLTSGRSRRRALAASLAAAAAAAGGLVLAGGSSGPGVNVAAAAYAATSTGGGVLEAQFVDRLFNRGRAPVTFHRREWIDTSTESQRTQRIFQGYIRRTRTMTSESATAPGRVEFWQGATDAPSAIQRFDITTGPRAHHGTGTPQGALRLGPTLAKARVRAAEAVAAGEAPAVVLQGVGSPLQAEGIGLYRWLYREHAFKLVGSEQLDGKQLWKLEGNLTVARFSGRKHAKVVPMIGLVVLVDPSTFLPVIQREIRLRVPGHPVTMETQLVSYRRLPADAASEALLQLSPQHPGVPVITTTAPQRKP